MLRHLISMTYFYIYFNQFRNILECYEETTVRRPAASTHTNSCLHRQYATGTDIRNRLTSLALIL